jgi:predicted CXXCH cytochrome family protein
MKKLVFALTLGLLFIAALATTALADNGPHGGSFSATTDACANCHRAHSAVIGENSLLVQEKFAMCMTCHNGSGAGTNVEDGVYSQTGADAYYKQGAGAVVEGAPAGPLLGGGFVNTAMTTAWNGLETFTAGTLGSNPTTSTHTVKGLGVVPSTGIGTVWGSGANNSTNESTTLECTSCHNPHGKAGWTVVAGAGNDTTVATYRLLKWQPEGSNGFTAPATAVNWSGGAFPTSDLASAGTADDVSGWTVPDNFATNGTEWYTIGKETDLMFCGKTGTSSCKAPFTPGDYAAGTGNIVYTPDNAAGTAKNYVPAAVNMAFFCAQCHDRYFNNSSLRDDVDASVYCGESGDYSINGSGLAPVFSNATLPDQPDADNAAPWIHPGDAAHVARCEPVVNASGLLTAWGDLGESGDSTYMFRHASGDIRPAMDGYVPATPSTTDGIQVKRSCMACHVAHGTSALETGQAAIADSPGVVGGSLVGDSALLRLNGRSMCLRCHSGVSPLGITTP